MARTIWSLLLVLATTAGGAGTRPAAGPPARVVLVELFTSQGCSSCPPADELVRELPSLGLGHDRVLPLTFHVDYWDRLGWPDRFAHPAFTARQAWYVRSGRLRPAEGSAREISGLYTPQMIVDGQVHLPGGDRAPALAAIRRASAEAPAVRLTGWAALEGNVVVVSASVASRAGGGLAGDWRLLVALAARRARTRVSRGENAGETLEEADVVRALSEPVPLPPAGSPGRPLVVRFSRPADLDWNDTEVTGFVQDQKTGEVVGAAAFDRR